MKLKALLRSELYWAGFGLFVGLPFGGALIAGMFDFAQFIVGVVVYTIVCYFVVKGFADK